jgi:osmoprotectant transport system substrate-binding protein
MPRILALFAVLALAAAACGGGGGEGGADGGGDGGGGTAAEGGDEGGSLAEFDLSGSSFTIGSKNFTEQRVLGYLALESLKASGAEVSDQVGLGGTEVAREALKNGDIDAYWSYNGTAWIEFFGNSGSDIPEDLTEQVREKDMEDNSIVWLKAAPFNNTYALAFPQEAASELNNPETISDYGDLVESSPEKASLCVETEFANRDDGLPGLEETYGFDVPDNQVSLLDVGAVYTATDNRDPCNFGEVFASDGRIASLDLSLLEDNENFFPPYNPSLAMRQDAYQQNPEALDGIFDEVASSLSLETMQNLNALVDSEGEEPQEVARCYLADNGFIDAECDIDGFSESVPGTEGQGSGTETEETETETEATETEETETETEATETEETETETEATEASS